MATVRLTQLDGKLPNLALMKLSRWHRDRGDDVHFSRSPYRDMLEPKYDKVYGSAIFDFSSERVAKLKLEFPGAIIGGTWDRLNNITVEDLIGTVPDHDIDYEIAPQFDASLGFTARGCRLKCSFCVVPGKEGPPKPVANIFDIYRGGNHPKHIHLLDNDFFGQPKTEWQARLRELREGNFRVCFNQGINIRMITEESAEGLASVQYFDDGFKVRRLYTAWDNIGDEKRFFDGIATLDRAGIPSHNILAYMLVGYDKRETWNRIFYRFNKMVDLGIMPYPMVYDPANAKRTLPLGGINQNIETRTLSEFQRWAIRKAYTFIPFEEYDVNAKGRIERRQLKLWDTITR